MFTLYPLNIGKVYTMYNNIAILAVSIILLCMSSGVRQEYRWMNEKYKDNLSHPVGKVFHFNGDA